MGIGIKELAKLGGVSPGAVSMIFNGKADGHIAPAKQELIRALAKEHNYHPNLSAKSLRARKRYTVGIIMQAPYSTFASLAIAHLQAKLHGIGYAAFFSFWRTQNEIASAIETVFQHHVDGIITWNYHKVLEREKVPAIIYDSKISGYDAVLLDFDFFAYS